MSLTIDVWFDYLCPFSVMTGKVIADTGLAQDHAVRWRPYELHPGGIPAGGKKDYPQGVWENSVVPMADRLGVPFTTAPSGPLPRTDLAMHGHTFAWRHGAGHAYDTAVFDAYFHHDQDIADLDTLADLAGQSGLDRRRFTSWTASPEAAEHHRASQEEARRTHRIHTVPTLVIGSWRTEGVPDAARLLRAVHTLHARSRVPA
ncbi:DsbA family protein [Streptomyces sp. NPDC047071]|uniref:DsbA family oxidoreductase n=1 Tax=Streptomyces sp. NPDC047071 TaxID=3154808 RepID=UPI0034513B0E